MFLYWSDSTHPWTRVLLAGSKGWSMAKFLAEPVMVPVTWRVVVGLKLAMPTLPFGLKNMRPLEEPPSAVVVAIHRSLPMTKACQA